MSSSSTLLPTPNAPPAPPVDQLGQGGQPTIQPTTPAGQSAPAPATIAPRTPSPIERITRAISEGIPAFNSKFEAASHTDTGTLANGESPKMQVITPEAGMTAKEKKEHPIATGIAETAGGLTDQASVALIAGSGGLGEVPGSAGKLLPKLLSLGFSAQALKGAYDQVPAFKKATAAGDESEAERIITHIVLDTAMGAQAGEHATEGVKAEVEGAGVPDEASTLKVGERGQSEKSSDGDNEVEPHITFDRFGGKEPRAPPSFGRTGGWFGRPVDQT